MAVCNSSLSFLSPFNLCNPIIARKARFRSSFICSSGNNAGADSEPEKITKRLSKQSSWEAKNSEGKDYLYRLGTESDNMNIAVGARAGVVDDLFTGNFLGRDSDIVFDYRQKVTRSFEYLQGDYYIAPVFMDKVGKYYETWQR